MNITRENIDELNAIVKVKVEKQDYKEHVDKVLNDYRRKASIKGFRPGKVPMGMIQKLYGKAALVDEVNKVVSEALYNHIKDENLKILGEPLPSKTVQPDFDIDNKEDFEFSFDLGLVPQFELKLSKRDKITEYLINADAEMIESEIKNYASRYGKVEETSVAEETSMLKGAFVQLAQDGSVLEGGIANEDGMFSIHRVADEDAKKLFVGSKIGDIIDFDINKAFTNISDLAAMLNVSKETAEILGGNFRFTVAHISTHRLSEINQELFDKVYGEGEVSSEEEFRNRIAEEIKLAFRGQTDYRLLIDAKEKLVNKAKIELPEAFLKRWLVAANEELSEENVERDWAAMQVEFAWQLIKEQIAEEQNIKIEAEELVNFAKKSILLQFRQYGLTSIPEEQLEAFAQNQLKKEEDRRKMIERLLEDKVLEYIKEAVKLEPKEVSMKEFNDLFIN